MFRMETIISLYIYNMLIGFPIRKKYFENIEKKICNKTYSN